MKKRSNKKIIITLLIISMLIGIGGCYSFNNDLTYLDSMEVEDSFPNLTYLDSIEAWNILEDEPGTLIIQTVGDVNINWESGNQPNVLGLASDIPIWDISLVNMN
ncbi:hypothetical protein H9660_06155 [Clostridium sp. Sa3CUN1]|uniref:Lipoprotein n=1 Tax=Clostridium gallinarum TaxID=2762246 RepID=A0ABR8Q2S9_9CLOT|nr:hypothetical protein [Clostridium gallinarum]MBD7914723.1 hypothetical protein [Clostridium gallinarum]